MKPNDPGLVWVANIKGEKGDKGATGALAFASAETVAWTESPTVTMVGPESARGAHFEIPLPMPGPELIQVRDDVADMRDEVEALHGSTVEFQDSAVSSLLADPDSETRGQLSTQLQGETHGVRVDSSAVVGAIHGATQVREQVSEMVAGRPTPWVEFFLDQQKVAGGAGVTFTKLKPVKAPNNPLFILDSDTWDADASYNSTHYDARTGRLHVTYYSLSDVLHNFTCYAYTDNPLASTPTFVKPNLGMVEYEGSTDNNISIEGLHVATRFDDLSGKWYLLQEPGAIIFSSDSPAGPWKHEKTLDRPGWDEAKDMVRLQDGRWVIYYSHRHGDQRRSIGVWVSDTTDLHGSWTDHGTKMEPINQKDQFYSLAVERYGDTYLGFTLRFDSDTDLMWMDLWLSHDGLMWKKSVDRWVDLGASGAWDDAMIIGGTRLSMLPDEWQFWYTGSPLHHGEPAPRGMKIGKATLNPGRLAEVTASTSGTVETASFTPLAGELVFVNANGATGTVTVEVVNAADEVLTTSAVTSDTYSHAVALPAGVEVRLRFTLTTGAKLYSYVVGKYPITRGSVQVLDRFERESGNWLGHAETGQRWIQPNGPWRTTWAPGDIRQAAASPESSLPSVALVDVGTPDYTVSADITRGPGQSPALHIRGTDSDNGLIVLPEANGARIQIYKRYSGKSALLRNSDPLSESWANSTTRNLKVRVDREVLTVYVDDVSVIEQVLTDGERLMFGSNLVGMYANDTASRFDNFTVM